MKKTMLTYKTLDRFEAEYEMSQYTPEQIEKIEDAAYCANMNQCAHPEWTERDIYTDFIRILGINKIELKTKQEEKKMERKPFEKMYDKYLEWILENDPNEHAQNMHVSISTGNRKMGAIPSVSLMPILTCPHGVECATSGMCYAYRMASNGTRGNVCKAYARNTWLALNDSAHYWREVNAAIAMSRYFRFHVSGDIPDSVYLADMVNAARANPHCEILCFTKRFDMVNRYIDHFGPLPKNLHLIFSKWGNLSVPNPHNLPCSGVIFKGEEIPENWCICGGNCFECVCRGVGCWQLQNGQTVGFFQH